MKQSREEPKIEGSNSELLNETKIESMNILSKKCSIIIFIILSFLISAEAFHIEWRYGLSNQYDRMSFGASPAIINLGPDVNSIGGEPDQFMEIITGSDEYFPFTDSTGTSQGLWHCLDALGNLEWKVGTHTDESRSSVAVLDFINPGDGELEIVGGTTSGWNVETLDRFGSLIWTFPSPPHLNGPFMWHSSPAVTDIVPDVSGFEIVIGNNPCNAIYCFQADPSDGVDDGISFSVSAHSDCFYDYGTGSGIDGSDWDVLWFYETTGPVISTPAVGDIDADGDMDVVVGDGYSPTYSFFPTPGGNIYCLDGPTGTLRWIISTGGEDIVEASPAIADFDGDGDLEVIVGAFDNLLYLIDGDEDGDGTISAAEMTTFDMGDNVKSSAAIADVNGDGELEIIAADMSGRVVCLSYNPPTTVGLIWETNLDTAIVSSPAIAGENDDNAPWAEFCGNNQRTNCYPVLGDILSIFIATMNGDFCRLDGVTGSVIDVIHLGVHIHTSPVIADIDLDCELEAVFTVCNGAAGFIPDTIFCIGTGLFVQDCGVCELALAEPICPIGEPPIFTSCPQQTAQFMLAETTYWDYPDTFQTYSTVIVRNGDDGYTLNLMGGSSRMNFQRAGWDTFDVSIWNNWNNGDTVLVILDSLITAGHCTTVVNESLSFVVDLEPPTISPVPSPSILSSGETTFDLNADDNIAGIWWSLMYTVPIIIHPDGARDTLPAIGGIDSFTITNLGEDDTLILNIRICDSIFDYGCSCPPNCTTYTLIYPIAGIGPIAEDILPDGISACIDQQIWIEITDSDGVDSSTILVVINNDTLGCYSPNLIFSDDTLIFLPDSDFWSNNETVNVVLIFADDNYGNVLQNNPSWTFYLDFQAPLAELITPADSDTVADIHQSIEIDFTDNLAGVLVDSSWFEIRGRIFSLDDVLANITSDSLTGRVLFSPDDFSMLWFPGETVDIALHLCDNPDTCGPNCADYNWQFFILPDFGCARMPNPFTPNSDEQNDFCQFNFPGMIYKDADIYIYDIYGVLVKDISVNATSEAKIQSRWYGKDVKGKQVPIGIYLYVIEVDGEVVCEGTVTVAR